MKKIIYPLFIFLILFNNFSLASEKKIVFIDIKRERVRFSDAFCHAPRKHRGRPGRSRQTALRALAEMPPRFAGATTTGGADAQLLAQRRPSSNTTVDGGVEVPAGNALADTDDHGLIEYPMRTIVNTTRMPATSR